MCLPPTPLWHSSTESSPCFNAPQWQRNLLPANPGFPTPRTTSGDGASLLFPPLQGLFTLSTCQERHLGVWSCACSQAPSVRGQGEEWGQSLGSRGRHPHLSCNFPALGSRARASLCSSRTRLAIETSQGTLCLSKGWLEARIRHFTGSKPRTISHWASESLDESLPRGCGLSRHLSLGQKPALCSPQWAQTQSIESVGGLFFFSWFLAGLQACSGVQQCPGRFPTTHIQRSQKRLALRKTDGLLIRQESRSHPEEVRLFTFLCISFFFFF